jgi:hypothetical protein
LKIILKIKIPEEIATMEFMNNLEHHLVTQSSRMIKEKMYWHYDVQRKNSKNSS